MNGLKIWYRNKGRVLQEMEMPRDIRSLSKKIYAAKPPRLGRLYRNMLCLIDLYRLSIPSKLERTKFI